MWYAQNYGDFVLHAAVNASLDNTIDSLGRDRFNEAFAQFLELKRQAADACADSHLDILPNRRQPMECVFDAMLQQR
jgi:hypothetical protein